MSAFGLDAETSALGAETSALGAETSALGAVTSAIARSFRQYRRGVSGNIGDCGVGVTPQICNRVTNHGDMSTFSKPAEQQTATSISYDIWLYTELPSTCIVKNHVDTKVHIYAFIMIILNDTNEINTVKLICASES